MLDVKEVCLVLRVSRNSLYKMLQSGELKGYRHDSRWRIPKEAVTEYIREQSGVKKAIYLLIRISARR